MPTRNEQLADVASTTATKLDSTNDANGLQQRNKVATNEEAGPSIRRPISPSSSSASFKQGGAGAHSHLGLRPKDPDSLHARLRTLHPQPKHISMIEDVTSSSTGERVGSQKRRGSRRPSSRDPSSNGFHSQESSGGVAGTEYDSDYSRSGASTPLRRLSTRDTSTEENAAALTSSKAGADELGTTKTTFLELPSTSKRANIRGIDDSELDDEYDDEDAVLTTDIGIYDEEVYDEYLGPLMGRLRRILVRNLRWESPLLAKHQAMVRTPRLDRYFVYTSLLGTHSFFLIFLPMSFWAGNAYFGRGLVNVLAFGVYTSSALKDALCIPRPYSPPVTRLVVGTTHLEYGFLSTHSTNSVSIALYLYLWISALREQDYSPLLRSYLWEVGLLYYLVSVVYGRIYAGMHSVMDCIAGCSLGAAVTLVQWTYFETIERLMMTEGWIMPLVVNATGLAMVIVHPQPLDDCPCFEDAIAFLAVVMGVVTGRWVGVRYNLLPRDDNPLKGGLYAQKPSHLRGILSSESPLSNLVDPALEAIKAPFASLDESASNSTLLTNLLNIARVAVMLVVGVACIMTVRVVVKTICRIILPPIFRFLQGTFGLALPRRHYTSSTDEAAPPAVKAAQQTSTTTRPRARTNSIKRQQQENGGATFPPQQPSKVQFTMSDGSALPVPFTHPHAHLPGDSLSGRIAGALSEEDRLRQKREEDASFRFHDLQSHTHAPNLDSLHGGVDHADGGVGAAAATSHFEQQNSQQATNETAAAGNTTSSEDDIRHYDVDVLTKVFVYHAIGLFASCILPSAFARLGLAVQ